MQALASWCCKAMHLEGDENKEIGLGRQMSRYHCDILEDLIKYIVKILPPSGI
jgi:hypothetical protein